MLLKNMIEETKLNLMKPAMLLITPTFKFPQKFKFPTFNLIEESKNIPDEKILETFSKNLKTEIIIISGIDQNCNMSDIRSFIFSSRKHFVFSITRPLIIIYSSLTFEQLKKSKGWGGLYSEMLQYGRVALKCGYRDGYTTTTHTYFGYQYN